MARKVTYDLDRTPHGGDKWLITDVIDGQTKNLQLEDLAQYFASTGTADPTKLGFLFNYAGTYVENGILNQGEVRYTGPRFANVTRIAISNRTSNGISTAPLTNILLNNDIKLTDVSSATSNAYGFYQVTNVQSITSGFLLTVEHIGDDSSEGNLPLSQVSIAPIGVPQTTRIGARIFDGSQVPSETFPNESPTGGDLYFRRFDDASGVERFEVYGPFNAAAATNVEGWGQAIDLSGADGMDGRSITRVVDTTNGRMHSLQFFTGPLATDAIGQVVTLMDGADGADGANFDPTLFEVDSDTSVAGQTTVTISYANQALDTFVVEDGTDGVTPVLGVNTDTL